MCKKVKATRDLEIEWVDKMAKKGWNCPLGSKIESDFDSAESPKANKSLKTTRCYKTSMKTQPYPIHVRSECHFDHISQQSCIFKTKLPPPAGEIESFADVWYTLTDNENFMVSYSCIQKTKEFWAGCVPKSEKMSDEIKTKILKHVKDDLKLSTNPSDMRSETDPLQLGSTVSVDCKEKESIVPLDAGEAAGAGPLGLKK